MTNMCVTIPEITNATNAVTNRPLVDLRRIRGRIWSWGSGAGLSTDEIDETMYRGYLDSGAKFIAGVEGRFGLAYFDAVAEQIFLCRDWVGEVPLHYYLADDTLLVANRIADIREWVGPRNFRYDFVRAVPHAHALVIDCAHSYRAGTTARRSFHVKEKTLWSDFASALLLADSADWNEHSARESELRAAIEEAVRKRLLAWPVGSKMAVLLSGGIDSLCIAYLAKRIWPDVVAYTLEAGEGGEDAVRAREIAAALDLPIRVVPVKPEEFAEDFEAAVDACEVYHLPNVYCAAGMRFLARAIERDGVAAAFCGEGVNEALGDYHDWTVDDPRDGSRRVLQCVDAAAFSQISGRLRYVWGRPDIEGRYNLALGSGLAKHGISRMVKPMLGYGVQLECPWLERDVMTRLVSIPGEVIERMGGKPGLMARVFQPDIQSGKLPAHFILESRKIRLQDASEHGRGGLTGHLLAAGFDQPATLKIFNRRFGAHLNPDLDGYRLANCQI